MATTQYIRYPASGGGGTTIAQYPNFAAFPSTAPEGTLAIANDTGDLYEFHNGSWQIIAGPGAALSVGTIDSQTASANGAVIANNQLVMQSATGSVPGLVNTTGQTFAGNKNFSGDIFAHNLSGTNSGDVTIGTANGLSLSGQILSLALSSTTTTGALSSTDWNTFNNKQSALTFGNLTDAGTDGIVVTGGTGAVIGTGTSLAQHVADTTHNGYLASADWNTFNGKQPAGNYITALTGDITAAGPGSVAATLATVNANVGSFTNASITVNAKGLITAASTGATTNLTDVGTDGITITNGTGAVLGASPVTLSQHVADATHNGYLSSTDWGTFHTAATGGITSLTGDATATGPGAAALTLATVNSNVGSFGSSSNSVTLTVNAKGLITAASAASITAPALGLTGTVLATNVVASSLTQVGTLTNGTWLASTITTAHGGTGGSTGTPWAVLCGGVSTVAPLQYVATNGTSGQVLTSTGATSLPTWTTVGTSTTGSFAQSVLITSVSQGHWNRSSNTFGAFTIASGTTSISNGASNTITVSAAATSGLGITFTPASSTAIYMITATFGIFCGSTDNATLRFNDGTNSFGGATFGSALAAAVTPPVTMTSIYAPGTGSAVTVLIQGATGGGNQLQVYGDIEGASGQGVQWTLLQIK